MKGKYIVITDIPDFDEMRFIKYSQIKGTKKNNQINMYVSKEQRKKSWKPNHYKNYSGVYFLMNGDELVYIGKTTHLSTRIINHKNKKKFDSLFLLHLEEGWEMDVLERIYIEMYKPKYNRDKI